MPAPMTSTSHAGDATNPEARAEPRPDHFAPPGQATLVICRGPQAGRWFPLNRDVVRLGRSRECDIGLDDATVSRRHAEINRESNQYVVTDVGSLNGTYVNQTQLDRSTILSDGDELRIGIFRLEFRAGPGGRSGRPEV